MERFKLASIESAERSFGRKEGEGRIIEAMGKLKKVVDELEDAAPGGKLLKGVLGNQKLGVNDVLFGRGTGISSYSGNINFRRIVMEYKVGASWHARCMDFLIVCVTRTIFEHLAWRMRVHGLVEPLSSPWSFSRAFN